jgi:Uma2 family endonuclease
MGTTTGLLTFEEFERLPDVEAGKLEFLDGEPFQSPPAIRKHMEIAKSLFMILMQTPLEAHTYFEMGYQMGRTAWLQPDVSIAHPGQPSGKYFEGAPLLAVEVISESNTAEFMDRKVKRYLANGGVEVWVVYPKTKCVWVFREGQAQEFRGTLKSEILPGLEINLTELLLS